jgi:hypothetical protein
MYPALTRQLAALRVDDLQREAARQRQIGAIRTLTSAARRASATRTRPRRALRDRLPLLSRRPRPAPDPAWPQCEPDGVRPAP